MTTLITISPPPASWQLVTHLAYWLIFSLYGGLAMSVPFVLLSRSVARRQMRTVYSGNPQMALVVVTAMTCSMLARWGLGRYTLTGRPLILVLEGIAIGLAVGLISAGVMSRRRRVQG